MRVPIRKGGKFTHIKSDPYMTQTKFDELAKNLARLKKDVQPELAKEVKRLALMGDFSENAAYQIAKGRLRSVNYKMEKITKEIAGANIIKENKNSQIVSIGHRVTIKSAKETKEYRILGSSETNPAKGTISHQSPLGLALLHKPLGATVELKLDNIVVKYEIIKIA
ncbi:MAG: hypothetical protein HOC78_02200 [Candidatus Komeilibacteria bacterium]|jgi:transcription elongation factor GreA|nr:hypothetical protein [Candidatus Komeilibacteria bacterium]